MPFIAKACFFENWDYRALFAQGQIVLKKFLTRAKPHQIRLCRQFERPQCQKRDRNHNIFQEPHEIGLGGPLTHLLNKKRPPKPKSAHRKFEIR